MVKNTNSRAGPDKSVSKPIKTQTQTGGGGAKNSNEINADDGYTMHQWRKERIWIEAINHENNSRKQWDDTWSFIADYDQKGNLKQKEELPERVNMFSETMPSSFGHQYGSRLNTEIGTQMTIMQNTFNVGNRKQKNKDLICYD